MSFDWHAPKNDANQRKHGVSFEQAQRAFYDPNRIIADDVAHSNMTEQRYYCFGKIGCEIITVRFTKRENVIWIIGAGYWRKGRKIYETKKT